MSYLPLSFSQFCFFPSAIFLFLFFPPPPPHFYCFPSTTTTTTATFLLFSLHHHHHHHRHISIVFPPPPPPPPHFYCYSVSLCFTQDDWTFEFINLQASQSRITNTIYFQKNTLHMPLRSKKVVSDSPGLVDFAIGLVNSVQNLPEGQVKFLGE